MIASRSSSGEKARECTGEAKSATRLSTAPSGPLLSSRTSREPHPPAANLALLAEWPTCNDMIMHGSASAAGNQGTSWISSPLPMSQV
eukprot:476081-Prorocentrum_minimum.AAC.3